MADEQMDEAKKETVERRLAEMGDFMGPMLVDYVWWKTAGKVEWEEVDEQVSRVLQGQVQGGNEKFVKLIENYHSTVAILEGRAQTASN